MREYENAVPILVVSKSCPKCKEAEELLTEQNIFYMKMIAAPETKEFVKKHKVKMAPTLIVGDEEFVGVSGVIKYIYLYKGWMKNDL